MSIHIHSYIHASDAHLFSIICNLNFCRIPFCFFPPLNRYTSKDNSESVQHVTGSLNRKCC